MRAEIRSEKISLVKARFSLLENAKSECVRNLQLFKYLTVDVITRFQKRALNFLNSKPDRNREEGKEESSDQNKMVR